VTDGTAADLTIDELAREAGMTVRNIRSHATRGLLPPPEVRARTGYYGAEYVARLRTIKELQANGYNLGAIKHLLAPFESERAQVVDAAWLAERFGRDLDPRTVERVQALGLVRPLGDGRFEVPSPTLLRAGEAVLQLGVPLETALDVIEQAARSADDVSDAFVGLFVEAVWRPFTESGRPDADWPQVREALDRLRPLATETMVAVFHQRMTQAAERAFG
jgi:DNA-binding transcriptional MerR regulator